MNNLRPLFVNAKLMERLIIPNQIKLMNENRIKQTYFEELRRSQFLAKGLCHSQNLKFREL